MRIRAAVLHGPNQPFAIEQLDLDAPHAGEVLVRLAACGVCHSDWHLVPGDTKHPMPVVAGHEGAGVVEAVGSGVDDVKTGDHVILSWAPNCGECFYCTHGRPNLCDTYTVPIWAGTMLDGTTRLALHGQPVFSYCGTAAFATHTVVPRQSCVVIRRDVPLESACLVGCAVATGVGAAMFTAKVQHGESVAVFGCGGVGLNVVQGARLCGATTIIAIDVKESKSRITRSFGATHFLPLPPGEGRPAVSGAEPGEGATADQIRSLTQSRGVDHAFEAVGIPRLQELAFDCLRPGGTLTLAGLSPMGSTTNFPGAIIARQEKTIKGSYYGTTDAQRDFPMLIDLYASGKLLLDDLVSKRWKLEQINEAFAQMLGGAAARGVIVL
ncbi:MAG: Zn-dependent alcohol dehydrogenase [Tepidisphaeraceae bacterium]